jgi:hypothetical protein
MIAALKTQEITPRAYAKRYKQDDTNDKNTFHNPMRNAERSGSGTPVRWLMNNSEAQTGAARSKSLSLQFIK